MAKRNSFSETTFAFAATQEITRLDPWWSTHVPIMPSLRRERRGGYDVRFDLPATVLLIQYKLSAETHHLRMTTRPRGAAKILQRLRAECRGGFCQFWTTDHQHRLLDRVARRFPYTYYVAPRFSEVADLHSHYAARSILANSIVVRLSDFPAAARGSSCRHRVISPHASLNNFLFSKPALAEPVDLRNELRGTWHEWVHEVPLAVMIEEIWERFPRIGKSKALAWARTEVTMARERIVPRFEAPLTAERERPRLLPPGDAYGSVRSPSTPRRPPWPTHLFREQRGAAVVRYDDKNLTQLLALSRLFSLAGLHLSLLQPSEKALANTRFHDEGM